MTPGVHVPSRWGAVSLGLFVLGICLYFYHGQVEVLGVEPQSTPSLTHLVSLVFTSILMILLGCFLKGQRRWALVGIVFLGTPFLAGAQRFPDEIIQAVFLAGLVLAMIRGAGMGWVQQPTRLVLTPTVLLTSAVLIMGQPLHLVLLVLVVLWGWKMGVHRAVLFAGLIGMLAGLFLQSILFIHHGRISLVDGIHGFELYYLFHLLLSAQSGILVFFPAAVIPFIGWRYLDGEVRQLTLAGAVLTAVLMVHDVTFHGFGYTWLFGPHALLPTMGLLVPGICAVLGAWKEIGPALKGFLVGALAWGGLLNWVYLQHSPISWLKLIEGIPMNEDISLWQVWLEGVPLPVLRHLLDPAWQLVFTALGITFVAASLYGLLIPFRGYVGTSPLAGMRPPLGKLPRSVPRQVAVVGLLLILLAGSKFLSGPRGWEGHFFANPEKDPRPSHLLLDGVEGRFRGWFDNPSSEPIVMMLRASGPFQLYVNSDIVFEEDETHEPVLYSVELNLSKEPTHSFHLILYPRPGGRQDPVQLFWSWDGRPLMPVGGELFSPRRLEARERFFTAIWRKKELVGVLFLALLLLTGGGARGHLRSQALPGNHSGRSG